MALILDAHRRDTGARIEELAPIDPRERREPRRPATAKREPSGRDSENRPASGGAVNGKAPAPPAAKPERTSVATTRRLPTHTRARADVQLDDIDSLWSAALGSAECEALLAGVDNAAVRPGPRYAPTRH